MSDQVKLGVHGQILAKNSLFVYTPPMKYGDHLHGTITAVDQKGRGIFETTLASGDVRRVAIPFASPGDVVDATFVKRDAGLWIGRLERIHTPSPDRTATTCPHAGSCGGCLWQHLTYDAQLALKTRGLETAYQTGGITLPLEPIVPSPVQLGYRNRMDYAVGWKGEVGLKEYGSWNRYIDLTTCLLLDEATPKILELARSAAQELGWEPWDARKHTGQFRYVVIRLGRNTQQRLIHLLVKDLSTVTEAQKERLCEIFSPWCTSLILGENTKTTDVSYAERIEALLGNDFLEEVVNGVQYRIHPNAFFQTNTLMAAELQSRTIAALGSIEGKHVLDLYGGIGFFGVALAKQGASVVGQELDAFAVAEAKKNAEFNNVSASCSFASGPVEHLPPETWKADAGIIDPPRAGLHPKALEALIKYGPERVVYVSCNYHSFIREWEQIKQAYDLIRVEPLDLFPQTPHIEVIHTLVRRAGTVAS